MPRLLLLLISSMALIRGSTAFATPILGFGYFPDQNVYNIDPVTGSTTVAGRSGVVSSGVSRSSVPGQFFVTTPVNLYSVDLLSMSPAPIGFGNASFLGMVYRGGIDLAYDAATGTLYGVQDTRLFRFDDCPPLYAHNWSNICDTTQIAALPPRDSGY